MLEQTETPQMNVLFYSNKINRNVISLLRPQQMNRLQLERLSCEQMSKTVAQDLFELMSALETNPPKSLLLQSKHYDNSILFDIINVNIRV